MHWLRARVGGFRRGRASARRIKEERGFTLIELVVVVAIIGILATVLLPRVGDALENARRDSARLAAREMLTGFERFYADNGFYPLDSNDTFTVTGVTYYRITNYATLQQTLSPYTSLPGSETDAPFTFVAYGTPNVAGNQALPRAPKQFELQITDTTADANPISIRHTGITY